jgi:hypothetical protein
VRNTKRSLRKSARGFGTDYVRGFEAKPVQQVSAVSPASTLRHQFEAFDEASRAMQTAQQ